MPVHSPVLVGADRAAELTAASADWPSPRLTRDQLADLELLLLGAFGPAPGYPEQTLRDGLRLPALVVPAREAAGLAPGDSVALREPDGTLVAVLRVGGVRRRGGPVDLEQERTAARARTTSRVEPDRHPEPAG
jgi:sulfate adenylyltransferase